MRTAAELAEPVNRRRWEALAECAGEANPFAEHWALLPAIRALGVERHLQFLCLEDDGILAGILPVSRWWRYYRYPLPHLANWVHGNAFLGGPLIARDCEALFWRKALAWADENAGFSLFWHLTCLNLDGPAFAALRGVADQQGRPFAVVQSHERAMIEPGTCSTEEYWNAAVPTKKRKELRRQRRRLEEEGTLTVERRGDDTAIDSWIADFLALEAAGWKGDSFALARERATQRVFTETMRGAATRGRLDRLTLRLDGKPIAMLATLLDAPGAFAYKTAYDENYARFSPGVLLQQENLRLLEAGTISWCDSCAAEGHPMIDSLWRERRRIGRVNIGIGGARRQTLYARMLARETGASQ